MSSIRRPFPSDVYRQTRDTTLLSYLSRVDGTLFGFSPLRWHHERPLQWVPSTDTGLLVVGPLYSPDLGRSLCKDLTSPLREVPCVRLTPTELPRSKVVISTIPQTVLMEMSVLVTERLSKIHKRGVLSVFFIFISFKHISLT